MDPKLTVSRELAFEEISSRTELETLTEKQLSQLLSMAQRSVCKQFGHEDPDIANDIAVQTWHKLVDTFDPTATRTGTVGPLVNKILHDLTIDALRSNTRRRLSTDPDVLSEIAFVDGDIAEKEHQLVLEQRLNQEIVKLKPELRELVEYKLKGLTVEEMSRHTGMSTNTITDRLRTAKEEIANNLHYKDANEEIGRLFRLFDMVCEKKRAA